MSGNVQHLTFGKNPGRQITIEMVPKPLWYKNVRSEVSKAEWDRLRKQTYRAAGHRCEICGGTGLDQGAKWPVECHEIWHYDDEARIQKLDGLICLCPMCHSIKHFGRTQANAGNSPRAMAYFAACLDHMVTVNGWDHAQVKAHVHEEQRQWQERSRHEDWDQDMSLLDTL